MAKELPYFKFIATEWMTGNIAFESYELQGLFINVCCLYWQRGGVLTISEIEKRYRLKKNLSEALERYITVEEDGYLKVRFLDRQFNDRGFVAIKNKANGERGGRPRALRQFELRFYVIKCFNEKESFFKAGITKDSVARRYGSKTGGNNIMPYNYEIIVDEITTAHKGLWLEGHLSKNFKQYSPTIKFAGHMECFEICHEIITETLNQINLNKPTGLSSVLSEEAKLTNIEEEEEKKEKKKRKEEEQELPDGSYQKFLTIYSSWYENKTGLKISFDGAQGNALKKIITYLSANAKEKNSQGGAEAWQYILLNWGKLDKFLQDQVKVTQIQSNMPNIINQLKNGNSKNKQPNDTNNIHNIIDAMLERKEGN